MLTPDGVGAPIARALKQDEIERLKIPFRETITFDRMKGRGQVDDTAACTASKEHNQTSWKTKGD